MDTTRLSPSQMVVGGSAMARAADGRVVFVSGAIAGETVDVAITSAKKDFAKAAVVRVVDPSPDRVVPPCEAWHRGCGGCDWQHIAPGAQLAWKTEVVREALQRTARLSDATVTAAGSVHPWNYRTTIRVAGRSDGRVGFRSRRSHEVVAVTRCPIADERINAVLSSGTIDGRAARHDDVMLRVGSAGDRVVIGGRGDGSVVNEVWGHRFVVSRGSFFQSSAESASLLVEAVARACHDLDMPSARVLDAYGGVGLFGATVARTAASVVLVESSSSSCADAVVNLEGQPATVVPARLEEWEPVPVDLVIADPARSGLQRSGAAVIAATGAATIVLISCDVGSLARDVGLLQGYGYVHAGTQVLDLFPNTSHVEAVTRFDLQVQSDEPTREDEPATMSQPR